MRLNFNDLNGEAGLAKLVQFAIQFILKAHFDAYHCAVMSQPFE
jgi:hypothetical protein